MTTTSSLAASKAFSSSLNSQLRENLFQKILHLQSCLETIQTDLYRLDEEAKSVQEEKTNVEVYLDERAEETKNRLMLQLNGFQNQVRDLINRSKKETTKIDEKITMLKNGQINTVQMILGLQRRVREVQVQLGSV